MTTKYKKQLFKILSIALLLCLIFISSATQINANNALDSKPVNIASRENDAEILTSEDFSQKTGRIGVGGNGIGAGGNGIGSGGNGIGAGGNGIGVGGTGSSSKSKFKNTNTRSTTSNNDSTSTDVFDFQMRIMSLQPILIIAIMAVVMFISAYRKRS